MKRPTPNDIKKLLNRRDVMFAGGAVVGGAVVGGAVVGGVGRYCNVINAFCPPFGKETTKDLQHILLALDKEDLWKPDANDGELAKEDKIYSLLLEIYADIGEYWQLREEYWQPEKNEGFRPDKYAVGRDKLREILDVKIKDNDSLSYACSYKRGYAFFEELMAKSGPLTREDVIRILVAKPFEGEGIEFDGIKYSPRIQLFRKYIVDEFIRIHVARSGFKRFAYRRRADGSVKNPKGLDFVNYNGYPGGFYSQRSQLPFRRPNSFK